VGSGLCRVFRAWLRTDPYVDSEETNSPSTVSVHRCALARMAPVGKAALQPTAAQYSVLDEVVGISRLEHAIPIASCEYQFRWTE
jgi:hypothetical protein